MSDEKQYAKQLKNFDVSYDDVEEHPVVSIASKEVIPTVEEMAEADLYAMEGRELLMYFARRFQEVLGFTYKVDWLKEHAVMKSFKLRYGPEAGPMIKLLFDKYSGMWNGRAVTVTAFSRGSKWIQDSLYNEVQQSRETMRRVASKQGEILGSDEFLKRFA